MIGFILPFKPKKESGNWENDNLLLAQTIHSILSQTNPCFKVYVVYSDLPTVIIDNPKVRYINFSFPFMEYAEVDRANPGEFIPNTKRLVERRFDKGRKSIYGCHYAKEDGCDYLMLVDADDLISNKLVSYIEGNKNNNTLPGWYVNKGYILNKNSGKILRQRKMHLFNGSTHILRSDLIDIPDFNDLNWQKYNWFVSHGWTKARIKQIYDLELQPIPFRAVIYVAHQSNISPVLSIVESRRLKNFLKRIIFGLKFSDKIKKEFGIDNSLQLGR